MAQKQSSLENLAAGGGARLLDKAWEESQRKAFTKWINSKLQQGGSTPITNMVEEFSDGIKLCQLLSIIGDEKIKYNPNPKIRLQKVENINYALNFIKHRGVALFNIGAEDIVDKNQKLILGLVWTIILRFVIADINEEGLTAKEGLLLWCQRKTKPYKEVNIKDFTYSWQDGLGFCALIHRHRPDLLDFDSLDKKNKAQCLQLAFDVAEKHLKIPKLLDVSDLIDVAKPDEKSIMTYVAEYFHAFSTMDRYDKAGRRISKLLNEARIAREWQTDYERRVQKLKESINSISKSWQTARFDDTYKDATAQSAAFDDYKSTVKREFITEKQNLEVLLTNIRTKLRTYKLAQYDPPNGYRSEDIESVWTNFMEGERQRRKVINEQIRTIKEKLRVRFADLANSIHENLKVIGQSATNLQDDLDGQLKTVAALFDKLLSAKNRLPELGKLEKLCLEAHIEENDHTNFSVDDLTFEIQVLEDSLKKKQGFIENQMVSRNLTNVTPEQLEEFESVFRYFDKDKSNSLNRLEFKAALASLGSNYADQEFEQTFKRVSNNTDNVTFEQFVSFMRSITEDTASKEQILESFKVLANGKDIVNEQEIRIGQVKAENVQYLKETLLTKYGGNYNNFINELYS